MELPGTVEWALHSVWLLAQVPDGAAVPGRRLAEFHGVPGPYLAKVLQSLARDGILVAVSGPRGGYRLDREPSAITVLDLVTAIEGDTALFRCQEIRRRGPEPLSDAACRQPCGIASVMHRAERAWRAELAATTVADLVAHAGTGSVTRARRWLSTVVPAGA